MPSPADPRSQTNLQAITLEYVVMGAFDGTTIVPPISLEPTSEFYVPPDPVDGVRRRTIEGNLGLVDLGLGGQDAGGQGDRYVRSVVAGHTGLVTSFINGRLGVVDDIRRSLGVGTPLLLENVRFINGVPSFYERSCILVPQGTYLGIVGLAASPDNNPNIFRIEIQTPMTPWHAALLEQACCCDTTSTDRDNSCPVIADISPSIISVPPPDTLLTIFGTGFRDGLAIEATRNPPDLPVNASLTNFAIIDSNTATVLVEDPTPAGTYTITIFDPLNVEDCSSSIEVVVEEGPPPPPDCPDVTNHSPPTLILGLGGQNVQLSGTNLLAVSGMEIRDMNGDLVMSQLAAAFTLHTDLSIISGPFMVPIGAALGTATITLFATEPLCPDPIENIEIGTS